MLEGSRKLKCSLDEHELEEADREKIDIDMPSDEEFDNYDTVHSKKGLVSTCSDTDEDLTKTDKPVLPALQQKKKTIKLWKRVPGFGILLILVHVVISNTVSVIIKELTVLEPSVLLLYRSIITTSFAMPWAVAIDKAPFPPELHVRDKGLLLIRGILGFINVIATIYSIRYMTLGDQKMLTATRPVFVAISARVFLKEKSGVATYISMVFMLVGIVFVIKPPFIFGIEEGFEYDPREMYSAIAVTISTILSSNNPVILRKLRKEHVISLSATNHLFFIIESFIYVMVFSIELYNPTWPDKLKLCIIALGSFFSGLLYNLALKLDKANKVSTIQLSTGIIVAYLYQILYFEQIPTTLSIIGASLVCVAIIIMTVKSFITTSNKFSV